MDTSEPAFPVAFTEVNNLGIEFPSVQYGMTLRDYFAGQALVGLLSSGNYNSSRSWHQLPSEAYAMANGMLEERGRNNASMDSNV